MVNVKMVEIWLMEMFLVKASNLCSLLAFLDPEAPSILPDPLPRALESVEEDSQESVLLGRSEAQPLLAQEMRKEVD